MNVDSTAWIRPAEAESLLGVSRRTLMRMENRGQVQAVRLPSGHRRFERDAIEALKQLSEPSA